MKKLLSKFKVLVPALVCLLALTMVLFTGCKEDVPSHTHSMTHVEGTAATCTTTGVKEHYHCKLCEKDFLTEEGTEEASAESLILAIDPENHDFVMANTQFVFAKNEQGEWTCTATTECSRNKEHKLVKTATKVAENETKEATCEKAGSKTLTATFEDKVYGEQGVVVKTEPISALGHNYGSLVAEVPATCTTNGTKEHYTCSVCHKNFDKNHKEIGNITLPAKHDLSYHAKQDPTCTATGNIEYWSCSVCGKNFSNATGTTEAENVTLDMIAHKYTNADGQTNYVYDYENARYVAACTRCNHQDETQTKTAGTEQYPYLANDEATFAAVITKGGYIKLAQDISVAGKIDIKKNVVIDLNGKKVSYLQTAADNHNDKTATRKNYCVFGVSAGEATIKNGTIEYTVQEGLSEVGQGRAVMAENTTKLTLTNVTITSDFRGIDLFDNSKTIISNCTITTKCESVGGNNLWGPSQEGNLTVTIENSTITSENETALFVPSYMIVNITNNSTLTGNTSAIYAMMGEISVDSTSTLHASATSFDVRTIANVGETGPNEAPKDGAALVIRSNYYYDKTAKSNKLTLNIADWSKVTSASGVKAAVYNWTEKSSYIAEAEKVAELIITDQFLEVVAKLADKEGVKFYEFNGTEIKEMSVYTYSYVEQAEGTSQTGETTQTEEKTYLMKIVATTKEIDMGGTQAEGMPKAYLFYTAGYEDGELQETSTGTYMTMDKDGKLIYVCVNGEEAMPLTFKVNQDNVLSLALYANRSENEAWFLFQDMKFGIFTRSAEGNTFAEYDCTISENTVTVTISEGTTRTFTIDKEKNTITEVK